MSLSHILIFSTLSLLAGWLSQRWRVLFILVGSLLAVYWIQPATPVRYLDFWLPTASIFITILVWATTRKNNPQDIRSALRQAAPIIGIVVLVGLTRYLGPVCCLTATRPPEILQVIAVSGLISLYFGSSWIGLTGSTAPYWCWLFWSPSSSASKRRALPIF